MRWMVMLLAANALWAAPVISEISPRGAQRGQTFKLHLRGEGLVTGAEMRTTLPGTVSRLVASKDMMQGGYELPFLVQLDADAPIGLYPLRVVTSDGLSNVMLFSVGDLPEQEENEAEYPKQRNDSTEFAEAMKTPGVMTGTLRAADVDVFAIDAADAKPLVVEVEARRAGSAIDPAIEVLDADGAVIARNDDAAGIGVDSRLEFTPSAAGIHYVRVHDSKYSNQRQNFYRLKVGSFRYAESLFPLGWRREPVSTTLLGGNLAAPVHVKPNVHVKGGFAPVPVPGSPLQPLRFVLSDLPETLEFPGKRKLEAGTVMNGRIEKSGEVDEYSLPVRPHEPWRVELIAASLGTSRLDALLTIVGPDDKKIAFRDDVAGSDPVIPFEVPEDVHEVKVRVEDLFGRGGPGFGYRLVAHRGPADFLVRLDTPFVNVPAGGTEVVAVTIQRRGYDGPIKLSIPDVPKGFHVAGGNVPSEADAQRFDEEKNAGYRTARALMTISADPDVEPGDFELRVVAKAGDRRVTATGPGMVTTVRGSKQRPFTAPWLGFHLPVAASSPSPITLTPLEPKVRIAQGVVLDIPYRVKKRQKGLSFKRVTNQRTGAIGNLRFLRGDSEKKVDEGYITLATNFATPTTKIDVFLTTTTQAGGKERRIWAPGITVEVVRGYDVSLDNHEFEIEAGGTGQLTGTIFREPTFEGGLVKVKASELPDHVQCEPVEVAAADTEFALPCVAKPEAKPGPHVIRIASEAPDTGKKAKDTYKIPDVDTKLVVRGAIQASK